MKPLAKRATIAVESLIIYENEERVPILQDKTLSGFNHKLWTAVALSALEKVALQIFPFYKLKGCILRLIIVQPKKKNLVLSEELPVTPYDNQRVAVIWARIRAS